MFNFTRKKNECAIPPEALTDPNGGEIFRAWVAHEAGNLGRAVFTQRFAATQAATRDRGIESEKQAKAAARGHCNLRPEDCPTTSRWEVYVIRRAPLIRGETGESPPPEAANQKS